MGQGDWPIRNGGALLPLHRATGATKAALTEIKPAGVVDNNAGSDDQTWEL
jgi:hypothetical protein